MILITAKQKMLQVFHVPQILHMILCLTTRQDVQFRTLNFATMKNNFLTPLLFHFQITINLDLQKRIVLVKITTILKMTQH